MDDSDNSQKENEGFYLEWIENNTILHVKIETANRKKMYKLENRMIDIVKNLDITTFLIIIDFSNGVFSPYMKNISNTVASEIADKSLKMKRSVVLPNNPLTRLIANWSKTIHRGNKNIKTGVFHRLEDAVEWLNSSSDNFG